MKRRGGGYAIEGNRGWGCRSGMERDGGLLTVEHARYCKSACGTNRGEGAARSRGPAPEHPVVSSCTLLRHLALLFGSVRGKQADRRPGQGLQLEKQEEGGDETLHLG